MADQLVVIRQGEHGARRGVEDAHADALALEMRDEIAVRVDDLAVVRQGGAGNVETEHDIAAAGTFLTLIDSRRAGDQREGEKKRRCHQRRGSTVQQTPLA